MILFSIITEIPIEMWLIGGLSLSIGWGIRGNFGHEIGAAMPGALVAMAIVLISGRPDWWQRIHFFAMFGAIGWSFGGSMSYMQVVGYTHSGHTPTTIYGFANLFAIGFLWAAPGGFAIALPAILKSDQLSLFFVPIMAVFIGWTIQWFVIDLIFKIHPMQRHESPLYWHDTDWLDVTIAMISVLVVVLIRGGFDLATSLIFHMAIGWWMAFLILVNLLKLRMTPPRGDNWAGCVGIILGAWIFCFRHNWHAIKFALLLTGVIGGVAFSLGQMIKLLWIRTGLQTNWHSVMEQTQGFLFGLATVAAIGTLSITTFPIENAGDLPKWMHIFAVISVLIFLTYLNHRKAVGTWIDQVSSLPERIFGLPIAGMFLSSKGFFGWFEIIYVSIGSVFIFLLSSDLQIPILEMSWIGRGQLIYVIFLWWIVTFNFERALTGFSPHRIITEGIITFNAILVTLLIFIFSKTAEPIYAIFQLLTLNVIIYGFGIFVVSTILFWLITRSLFGLNHISHAGLHIRFGPNANATKSKPRSGNRHP